MEPLTFQSMNFERIPTDVETTKTRALQNAERALRAHEQHKQAFDTSALPGARSLANPALSSDMERPQPSIFEGKLKGYQLKVSSRQTKQSIFYVHVHVIHLFYPVSKIQKKKQLGIFLGLQIILLISFYRQQIVKFALHPMCK